MSETPSEAVPVDPVFSLDDLSEHVDNYGVDIFPPIDISKETVRAQAFFLEMRDRWPYLFQSVTVGGAEFRIQTTFQNTSGQQVPAVTFNVTPRGPVFTMPRRLTVLGGDVDLHGVDPSNWFGEAFQVFFNAFPGRQALRVGLVRNLQFATGQTDCTPWLGRAVLAFGNARLAGAQCALGYIDDEFNISIQIAPVQMATFAIVPNAGPSMATQNQYGLAVAFDVNNRAVRQMTVEDAKAVVAKANELWPSRLIHFLNNRSLS